MKIRSFGRETGAVLEENGNNLIYHDYGNSLNAISVVMGESFNIDSNTLTKKGFVYEKLLLNDLNKNFVKSMCDNCEGQYLIIDLSNEIFDIVLKGKSKWLYSWIYKESNLNIPNTIIINRFEYDFMEWKKEADKFIDIIVQRFGNRIILHELYYSEEGIKNNKKVSVKDIEKIRKYNNLLKKLYNYLKENIKDLNVISIDNYNYTDFDKYALTNCFKKNDKYNDILLDRITDIGKLRYKHKVSVVIVSYNVKEYIEEAISSVLSQTLDDVECIIVDDGSNDGTQDIIKNIVKNNKCVKYKFIKNTGTPSTARNIGINMSSGKYIMFLDGDDYIEDNACSKMYQMAEEKNADLIIGKMLSFKLDNFFDSSKNISKYRDRYEYFNKIDKYDDTSIFKNPVLYLFPSACAKLYRRELIEGITFNTSLRYGEDRLFAMETSLQSKKTIVIDDVVYFYRIRVSSNTKSTTQEKKLANVIDYSNVMKKINDLINKFKFNFVNSVKFYENIFKYNMQEIISYIQTLNEYNEEEREEVLKILIDTYSEWYKDNRKYDYVMKNFTLYNYISLKLFFDGNIRGLLKFIEVLKKIQMHDYLDTFPCRVYREKDNIYIELKDYFKINISFYVEKEPISVIVTDIEQHEAKVKLRGISYINQLTIEDKSEIDHRIYLKERNTNYIKELKIAHKDIRTYSTSLYKYNNTGFECEIDFLELPEGVYDFYIVSNILGIEKKNLIKNLMNKVALTIDRKVFKKDNDYYQLLPIIKNRHTFAFKFIKLNGRSHYIKRIILNNIRRKQVSIRQVKRNNGISKVNKRKLITAIILEDISKLLLANKKIWLIGEKVADSACDAGFVFYKYCIDKKKRKSVYYLLKKDCESYKKLKKKYKIIKYYSLKHIIYSMNSKCIFSTDNPNLLLPSNISHLRNAKRVFIQHGIILPQRIDHVYNGKLDTADFVITSSEFEKQILMNHYGFNNEQLLNFGLARFDVLRDTSTRNVIMMTFTWRKDILNREQLIKSKYFCTINNILNNPKLGQVLEKYNIILKVALHPRVCNMLGEVSNGMDIFEKNNRVEILNFNNIDVRELIQQSKMLITDYSSLVFDFVYQDKPVVNYIFDNELALIDKEIYPAKTVYDIDELIKEVEKIFSTNKSSKEINKCLYINNLNRDSCEKIYNYFN